jgi:hypothetical protein
MQIRILAFRSTSPALLYRGFALVHFVMPMTAVPTATGTVFNAWSDPV